MNEGPSVAALADWLADRFSVPELDAFLRGQGPARLVRALPSMDVGSGRYCSEAAEALRRHDALATGGLWEALIAVRPLQRATIAVLALPFGVALEAGSTPSRTLDHPLPDGHQVIASWRSGRYLAVREVGKGGAGTVYQAWDTVLGRWWALKELHANLCHAGDEPRRRFLLEARVMANVLHPHIVRLIDVEEELRDGGWKQPYQVCEWVEGEDLDQRLRRGRLPLPEAVDTLLPVLDALGAAHRKGVFHLDVKPANILLSAQGPRLCDFGLARLDEDEKSHTRMGMVGTWSFISPEQRGGKQRVDGRADVYGAAATLVAAVTGDPKPDDLSREPVREELLERLPEAERRWLEPVVARGCAWKVGDRFASVAALAEALRRPGEGGGMATLPAARPMGEGESPQKHGPIAQPESPKAGSREASPRRRSALATMIDWFSSEISRTAAPSVGSPVPRADQRGLTINTPEAGTQRVLNLPGGVELPLRYIPAGTFWMGSPEGVGHSNEHPRHQVTLSKAYWLGETPLTQAQWQAVAPKPLALLLPRFPGLQRPMESISWHDACAWLEALSNGVPGATGARLPTEAEWERACRAGTDSRWSHGEDEGALRRYAWFGEGSHGATHPVGGKLANPWGIHDMYGNVWEWCIDDGGQSYTAAAVKDPRSKGAGAARGGDRMRRGGSYWTSQLQCRSAFRDYSSAGIRSWDLGFRVVLPAAA